MKLVLFDIDETLVNMSKIHRLAFSQTMDQAFGVECQLEEIDYSGKSLKKNLVAGAKLKGVFDEDKLEIALGMYVTLFAQALPEDAPSMILPGVLDLLSFLKDSGDCLGVVTGDTEALAELILGHCELDAYFEFVVTHDHYKKRADMVEAAIKLGTEKHGTFDSVFVIGDSVHDIDSAKGYGKSIAVCTGRPNKEELLQHNPDYIVNDLSDKEVKKILGGKHE